MESEEEVQSAAEEGPRYLKWVFRNIKKRWSPIESILAFAVKELIARTLSPSLIIVPTSRLCHVCTLLPFLWPAHGRPRSPWSRRNLLYSSDSQTPCSHGV